MDELYSCYKSYSSLSASCTYHLIVARKNKQYSINLQFELEQFIHLTGIRDHLYDLPLRRYNLGHLRKSIEDKQLTMSHLRKSQFFCCNEIDICARIHCLTHLDTFLRSDNLVIDYLERSDFGSKIEADWLISGQIEGELCYLFLVAKSEEMNLKDRAFGDYVCRSIFPERGIVYGKNGRKMTLLLKQRNSTIGKDSEIIYCHPKFKPEGLGFKS